MAYISAAMNKLTENSQGNVTEDELQNELNKSVGDNKTDVSNVSDILYVTFFDTTHNYKVESGKVSKIDSVPESEYTGIIVTADNASVYEVTYTDSSGNTKSFTDEIEDGDIVICGDYEYHYNQEYYHNPFGSGWSNNNELNGWGVKVIDKSKSEYGELCGNILGKKLKSITCLFGSGATGGGCNNLTTAPRIPEGIIKMGGAFQNCRNLKVVTSIPKSVIEMDYAFCNCQSLEGMIEINANPSTYDMCFSGAAIGGEGLVVTGSSTMLDELIATGNASKITKGIQ